MHRILSARSTAARILHLALFAGAALVGGCCSTPDSLDQAVFNNPDVAVEAVADAARAGNTDELLRIFGPEGREVLSSGDPVADKSNREVFVVAIEQGWSLQKLRGGYRELLVGHERWPFPIPLKKECYGWRFDTEAGKQEVLARRIGRNELAVIGACRTYAIAQREYAAEGRDGKPAGVFAAKVRSTAGKHDGLYWETKKEDEKPSPLGALAAQAEAEGYTPGAAQSPRPFHGYYFRILTAQGDAAPGGAKSYLVDGLLKGGHALVAFPAEYRNSGVMTFLVGPDGVVHEADLGQDTAKTAAAMDRFNPDSSWRIVE